jgi:hypothetical protein
MEGVGEDGPSSVRAGVATIAASRWPSLSSKVVITAGGEHASSIAASIAAVTEFSSSPSATSSSFLVFIPALMSDTESIGARAKVEKTVRRETVGLCMS